MNKLLIVDDEQDLCEILQFNLQNQGYQVETANSAEEALKMMLDAGSKCQGALPDLILLDVMMEGMSGFQLAQRMKQQPELATIPIIFCTAKDSENDTLTGFNLGADDYISKPFRISEVAARVRAVLKRCEASQPTADTPTAEDQDAMHALVIESLTIDMDDHRVFIENREIGLTHKEYDVLLILVRHQGRTFSRQEILDQVWPDDVCVLDRTVDVTIARLRKKLGEEYGRCITARSGYGYMFKLH